MTDDEIIPFNGSDTPEDSELGARIARLYSTAPSPSGEMVARCTEFVLQRVATTTPDTAPRRFAGQPRRWVMAAAAIAAILLISVTVRSGGHQDTVAVTTSAPSATVTPVDNGAAIQFELRLPKGASKVAVVGDWNGWDTTATPMQKSRSSGEWSAKVTLLPGRHVYAYIVNGERWIVDPLAPQVSNVDYGPANALVVEGGTR